MAIQLNERDHLIFKFIDEHQVLLEKHISWFISGDDKPVLIRDRLRKLFYLDYLLCLRHATKLPWWTTPTKPLVYMLSSMTRAVCGLAESEVDLHDSDAQRHLLEVANLRMLYLIAVKETAIRNFEWTTCSAAKDIVDAKVSFVCGNASYKMGVLNQSDLRGALLENIESALRLNAFDKVLIVSRDDLKQGEAQDKLLNTAVADKCLFATHQELYKTGMAGDSWQKCDRSAALCFKPAKAQEDGMVWNNAMNLSVSPLSA